MFSISSRAITVMTPTSGTGDDTFVVDFDTGLAYLVPAAAQPTSPCHLGNLARKSEYSSPLPLLTKPSPAKTALTRAPPPPSPSPPPSRIDSTPKLGLATRTSSSSVTVRCRRSRRRNGRSVQGLRFGIRGFLIFLFILSFFAIAVTMGPAFPLAACLMFIFSMLLWWISSRPMAFGEGVSINRERGS